MPWVFTFAALCMAIAVGFILGRRRAPPALTDSEDDDVQEPRETPQLDADEDDVRHALSSPLDEELSDDEPSRVRPSVRAPAMVQPSGPIDKPTLEFEAAPDPHEEITAQGANQLVSLVRATLASESESSGGEDEERTSFQAPDQRTLDSLRALAASAREKQRAKAAFQEEVTRPRLSSFAPRQSSRPAAPANDPAQISVRSDSFYLQSNVQTEERIVARRTSVPAGATHTSGMAPSASSQTATRSVQDRPVSERQVARK